MTEQELKEKIVGIVYKTIVFQEAKEFFGANYQVLSKNIADALISAEIGNVSEYKHRLEVAERAFRNFLAEYFTAVNEQKSYDCGIPEMFGRYANVLPYEDIVTSRLNEYLDEAEKELAEENNAKN